MTLVLPVGPVTPHGKYAILKGDQPMVSLISPNGQIVLWLMGGHSMADPTRPECLQIDRKRPFTGLMAPWQTIDQQGATEDGTTFVDALYEPLEVNLPLTAFGRDAKQTRRVIRLLHESLDVHQQSELGWMTHEMGYWWAPIRWLKPATDPFSGIPTRQNATLQLRADSSFWQSYPDLDSFGFLYEDMVEEFSTPYPGDLGPNWPQRYDGDGGGYQYAANGLAKWRDDPDDFWTTRTREVVNGPYKDFETATDNQVATIVLGAIPEWSLPESGANDIWVRMGRLPDGSWDGSGVRARIQMGSVSLTAWIDYAVVWSRGVQGSLFNLIIPSIGEKWSLVAGYEDKPRLFKIMRGGATLLQFQEPTATSLMGADNRGIGFGVRAAGALITQASPATVRRISAGDNSEASQSGFLKRHNAGDQKAYDEYTLYGPFTKAKIANGPGSADMVEFGPLAVGEIAHIRTDPRRRMVFDFTERTGNVVTPVLFGANPSDTMTRKLKGRFTSECAIPPKESGMRVEEHLVACSIQGGNADSRIDAMLTPLRRYPQ